jgi:hypothetical protein
MNIVKNIEQFDNNNIFFCDPIKNNIMSDSKFIRILYSTSTISLNGIYLHFKFSTIACEKYYMKYKCYFNLSLHKEFIEKIKTLEESLLEKCNIRNKIPQYKIYEQLRNGHFKIYTDIGTNTQHTFILKISGIWETQNFYGLTYKFLSSS